MMSWSSRIFCTVYFTRRKFFERLCFISMYNVLNTLSEYTYLYTQKNITSYTCLFLNLSKAFSVSISFISYNVKGIQLSSKRMEVFEVATFFWKRHTYPMTMINNGWLTFLKGQYFTFVVQRTLVVLQLDFLFQNLYKFTWN